MDKAKNRKRAKKEYELMKDSFKMKKEKKEVKDSNRYGRGSFGK